MRRYRLLVLLLLCLGFRATAQQEYEDFRKRIGSLPETVLFDSLSDFESRMRDQVKFAEAKQAIDELFRIAAKQKDPILSGRAHFSQGYLERDKSNASGAIIHYRKALEYFTEANDYKGQVKVLDYLGFAYVIRKEYDEAGRLFQRGLQLALKASDKEFIPLFYRDLAMVEDQRKNYAGALDYNGKALAFYGKNDELYPSILMNRGIILKNAGRFAESEKAYLECLAIAEKNKDDYLAGYVYLNYPNTLLGMGRTADAEKYITLGEKWAQDQAEKYRFLTEVYDIRTRIYEKEGRLADALAAYRQWSAVKDTVARADRQQELTEAETRFKTREQEREITRLDEDNLLKERQFRWLLIGTGVLVLLLAGMVWQYAVIRKNHAELARKNTLITERNRQIGEQAEQLRNLMKELHHRVKNNLAIVSGLLRLQSSRLEDQEAIRAVKDGQQRVEAMSLIHQRLYQGENVTRVNMRDYIHDLVNGLIHSYGFSGEQIGLELDIAPVELDVETAVPVGLILNEIITNSFKHAFEQIDDPRLTVRLEESDELLLEVGDNGPGVDGWQKDAGTFGKRLIQLLCDQLEGRLSVSSRNGTLVSLVIPYSSDYQS
ncbi:sensor histidine kinase [Siphonobacter aquaeclarae]|uniref:histidine kinase n=1 Tax=Siphonobacter aquaeclarae TaxID=563176 RepID=A0A1G9SWU5_9BACT|nr:histidine kinase dimerization/phosphoacceptor domain -containing protein [Siphonobacter aquaeclarae]SDM39882.1 Two-component sensor histidine kinase, contains HisKA and HATPase domains [Siphonobacter aquaeclarae]